MAHNVLVSLKRLVVGYGLGIGTALVCAMGMSLLNFNRWFFSPIISAVYPIPKSAFYPLLVIWLGPTDISKVLLVAIAAFFPMVINTLSGLNEVPSVLVRAARNLGAGPLQIFFRVALPAALPAAYAGATLGSSVSLIMLVYSEMTAAEAGIGFYMYEAASLMNTESAFAGVAVLAVIGFLWYQGILWVQKVHCPWRQEIR
jgi:NitT/TauT family transport system permease protein